MHIASSPITHKLLLFYFWLPAILPGKNTNLKANKKNKTEGVGGEVVLVVVLWLHSANMNLPLCGKMVEACFTLFYKAGAFSEPQQFTQTNAVA